MERGAERIAYNLKDMPVIRFDGVTQDGMMPRPRMFPRIGMFARKFGTAFDVGEEECNRA